MLSKNLFNLRKFVYIGQHPTKSKEQIIIGTRRFAPKLISEKIQIMKNIQNNIQSQENNHDDETKTEKFVIKNVKVEYYLI